MLSVSTGAFAQAVEIPSHKEPYVIHTGFHSLSGGDVSENDVGLIQLAYQGTVQVPGARWLRLYFNGVNLGANSFIIITAPATSGEVDVSQQRLDAETMALWKNTSAYFNGDRVEIRLYVVAGDQNVFFSMNEVGVGDGFKDEFGKRGGAPGAPRIQSICGNDDDRVSTTDDAVGRLIHTEEDPRGCTSWLIESGAVLTAGHCLRPGLESFEVLQFRVPDSDDDGAIQHPPAQHQYPIQTEIASADGGRGNDWAVLTYGGNALLKQRAFHRISRDVNMSFVQSTRISGYGVDGPPPDHGLGPQDQTNQTLQTHEGPFDGETIQGASDVVLSYRTDTQPANSGSPVLVSGLSIGIHTHGGCTPFNQDPNEGTSFENDALEAAIESSYPAGDRFVDNGHPDTFNEGTLLRPAATVGSGIVLVSSGGTLSIAPGAYAEAVSTTKSMTLKAVSGAVRIGPNPGPLARIQPVITAKLDASADGSARVSSDQALSFSIAEEGAPREFSLEQNYPNPFNPTTAINYALKERVHVTLKVYNLLGQEVATLVDAYQGAGVHSVVWNGRSKAGAAVPSGTYFYHIAAGDFVAVRQMILLK